MLGGPILVEIGMRFPEDWLGSTEALGAEIRKFLLSPNGDILPPVAAVAALLEETTPITGDLDVLLKVLARLAAIQVFLDKANN